MAKLINCARCGGNHDCIEWERLERPVEDDDGLFEYWSPCPTNGQPILMQVKDK